MNSKGRAVGLPKRSRGIFSDLWFYFLRKPPENTLIRFSSIQDRENYSRRVMQRLGMPISEYAVLNVHKIGIRVPVRYVFEELLSWDGDSTCWPNHLAKVRRIDNSLENIRIFLLGREKYPLGLKNGIFGFKFIPLFELRAKRIKAFPDPADYDNARYLLYECSGGYPIGIFSMYARSSIDPKEEKEQTQLFLLVGFNFYGRKDWTGSHTRLNWLWEKIHNRVTANVMGRFKQLCEWKFRKLQEGLPE